MCTQSKCECKAAKPHVHAASMKLYAEDAAETDKPWERWEVKTQTAKWYGLETHPLWEPTQLYRRKRKMRVVNCFSVPAPETEDPGVGRTVFIADPAQEAWYSYTPWYAASFDRRGLARGRIFLNEADAIANAKAMCGIDPNL